MPQFLIIKARSLLSTQTIIFLIIPGGMTKILFTCKVLSKLLWSIRRRFCLSPEWRDVLGSKKALLLSDTLSDNLPEFSQRFCHSSDQTARSHNHNRPLNGPRFTHSCSYRIIQLKKKLVKMRDNQQLKPRVWKHLVEKWQMCLICQGDVRGKLFSLYFILERFSRSIFGSHKVFALW